VADLLDYVRSFKDLRVLVLGDAMLDTYLEGSAQRLCSEGPVPVVQRSGSQSSPGGAGNTAANLRAMGADVHFPFIRGNDQPGQTMESLLHRCGISCSHRVIDTTAPTIHKLRILANGQYVVRFDEGERDQWSVESQRVMLDAVDNLYGSVDLVVISDYGYGTVSDALVQRLGRARSTRPKPLFVDSKDIRRCRSIGATVMTPNHLEAFTAVERRAPDHERIADETVEMIGRRMLALVDAEAVAITRAADGVTVVERTGQIAHIPAGPVVDPHDVGAGDSFLAALALSVAVGAPVRSGARIAIEAARLAVRQSGTAVVSQQELLQQTSLSDRHRQPRLEELIPVLDRERALGKTIVFTNGVFDILHAGHVEFLRAAKALGDILVVGVNSDASVRRLKGRNRPINAEHHRAALLAALETVDHVIVFDEDEPSDIIRTLRPHVHAKGGDYEGRLLPEAQAVEDIGGRVYIVPLSGTISTTAVIERILSLGTEPATPREPAEMRA